VQKAIKGLLFDKDGTLFDFHATWGAWCARFIDELSGGDPAVFTALAQALEYDSDTEKFLPGSFVVTDSMDTVIAAVHRVMPDRNAGEIFDFVCKTTCEAPQQPVVPLEPLFTGLRGRGYKIGIATNDNAVPARAHLQQAGVLEIFDHIVACDSGFGAKPEPGMLWSFSDAMALDPAEVAMIGDSVHDLKAGRAAGMVTVGVTTGVVGADTLAPYADVILPDIGHIPAWLDA